MADLLYITCNLTPNHRSRTLSLGSEFLKHYLRCHPEDEVQFLDLYRDNIQRADQDLLEVWRRSARGESAFALNDEERRKVSRVWRLADHFTRCDRYVFVTHSLNLWFPAEFKMYVDTICVPDRTYRVTPQGAQGRLADKRRKSLHLHAASAIPFGEQPDLSVPYLSSLLFFLGVTDQETVVVNGDDPEEACAEETATARRKLQELARRF